MSDILQLPPIGWRECTFDPVRVRSTSRMEGRRTESVSAGTPYWKATYKAVYLSEVDFGLMDAFMMQAGEDGDVFLAYDAFRPRPIMMDAKVPLAGVKASGGAFTGDAVIQALSARSLSLSGLPANFRFAPGDYVEIRKSPLMRSLHRVIAAAQASAVGEVSLSIRYNVDLQHFNTNCTAHLEKPSCTMQIDPDSYSATKSWSSREPSFNATEVFIKDGT
ncbi:hypothetical protein [Agrobacterium rosae]|uniref:Uncharacterized protein n=1 Tax=Agrobacterium rosae TaxID=1972867 RepID=A0AAW9FEM9_9HYPH|nr:hypothetical protein [Agrobacterium rosae]MDX8301293.1 hypothetical protein [Agrobacterium rosae]